MKINREVDFANKSLQEVFTMIYKAEDWKSSDDIDSISGQGSTLKYTKNLRAELPKIIKTLKIKTLIDLGCGDLKWSQPLLHLFKNYKGIDIVSELITRNKKKYSKEGISFDVADITRYRPVGKRDAALLKDVLVHLTNEQALQVINNLKKANITYLMATNFIIISKNTDIKVAGTWRPMNLSLDPFNLGEPLYIIKEPSEAYSFNEISFNDKTISIWKIN